MRMYFRLTITRLRSTVVRQKSSLSPILSRTPVRRNQ
jgi:hypothetical protein